eukprot:1919888-Pleurochrysis_carterae.AAC.1
MKTKAEALTHVKRFIASFAALVNKHADKPRQLVGTLHSDNAGEFLSTQFKEFLADSGVHSTTCPPHVHELNGVAERAIRSVMELARASLVAASAPTGYWDHAVAHAVDILNRTSCPPGGQQTSYELAS